MNRNRLPAGTTHGGQFTAAPHEESGTVLEVEFAADEVTQAELALVNHEAVLVTDQRSASARDALAANQAARNQIVSLRTRIAARLMGEQPFATGRFDASQIRALGDALDLHREQTASRARVEGSQESWRALDATDAALFRVDVALDSPG